MPLISIARSSFIMVEKFRLPDICTKEMSPLFVGLVKGRTSEHVIVNWLVPHMPSHLVILKLYVIIRS